MRRRGKQPADKKPIDKARRERKNLLTKRGEKNLLTKRGKTNTTY